MKIRDPITITFIRHTNYRVSKKGEGKFRKTFDTLDQISKFMYTSRNSLLLYQPSKELNMTQQRILVNKYRNLMGISFAHEK